MGGGIGQWLLCRADDGSMSLFSLVVPPRSETPVHDHLAWGLVGLYCGAQDEEIYAETEGVRTTSAETSVSIHLLTNDTGCVWRHAYDPAWARQGRSAPATSTSPATTEPTSDKSYAGQSSIMVPTALWTNASGKRAASRWTAFHPVQ
jgi:hypothetical protein